MIVSGQVWMSLTYAERMVCLEFAAWETKKRMKKATK